MIIAFSGSVGVGKTTIARLVAKELGFECIELNKIAEQFKIEDVEELQTFDFDLDNCLDFIEKTYAGKNVVLEGHFAHLLDPTFVDKLVIINRDLEELKEVYEKRGYNEQKISDNLEVETFNVCFYEAEEEGYGEHQFIVLENDCDLPSMVKRILKKLRK